MTVAILGGRHELEHLPAAAARAQRPGRTGRCRSACASYSTEYSPGHGARSSPSRRCRWCRRCVFFVSPSGGSSAASPAPSRADATRVEFANPVLPGMHPDPSICRVGRDFYLACSSFEYFPGVPLYASRDLVTWRPIGHALSRRSQLDLTGVPSSGGIYAPTLRHHDGTFFVVTTLVGRGNFVVTARDPRGPWSDPIWLDDDGIDPSLAFLDERIYYTRNGRGADPDHPFVYQGELTREADGFRIAAHAPRDLERHRRRLAGGAAPLPPGRLVLHGHRGGWHELRPLRRRRAEPCAVRAVRAFAARPAAHPPRPPAPPDPGDRSRGSRRPRGRNDLGRVARHPADRRPSSPSRARDVPRAGALAPGRLAAHAPDRADDAGASASTLRRGGPGRPPGLPVRRLPLEWRFVRNPVRGACSLRAEPGFLRLWGGAATLDDVASPSLVCRRQQHLEMTARARILFEAPQGASGRGSASGPARRSTPRSSSRRDRAAGSSGSTARSEA